MATNIATIKFLDAIALQERDRHSGRHASDYRIAQLLGVNHSAVSNYRNRGNGFDIATCWKVAELLGMDARQVIAEVEADRAKDETGRRVWLGRLAALGGKAAAVGLSSIALLHGMPADARPSTVSADSAYFTILNILHRIAAVARQIYPRFSLVPALAFR